MTATEKCPTCEGAGTLTEWDVDGNDVATLVTTVCDDCNGVGSIPEPTPAELAQQAADRAAYIAQRNADHFAKGYHNTLCGKVCRLNLT